MILLTSCTLLGLSCRQDGGSSSPADSSAQSSSNHPAQNLSRAAIQSVIERFEPLAQESLDATGVPGMAIAIVFDDTLVYAQGFGVKKLGAADPVDADTVFQLASLSKPLASSVVAGLVGQGVVAWQDPIVKYHPGFLLSDPLATQQVSFADLFSHRSGLPGHAGDLLEDLGFDRAEIISRLQYLPLEPIRTSYAYTNFGLTEAAVVAAKTAGLDWNEASSKILYEPLGMDSSSSSFEGYMARENRALPHVLADGKFVATPRQRQPDAQSPAGGASASVTDLARWMRLTIKGGEFEGNQIIDATALAATQTPHVVSRPPDKPGAPTSFYGLGWGVNQNSSGQVVWSHSGAFLLGAATNVTLIPAEGLGIVILTNGTPVGLPESLAHTFTDLVFEGEPTRNWLELFAPVFAEMRANPTKTDWNSPSDPAEPAAAPSAYVGSYQNPYFGTLDITENDGGLTMALGPKPTQFVLTHHSGHVFRYEPVGENAVGPSGVTFTIKEKQAVSVVVENLDEFGLGTFTRQ
jgi:CubicO group peptidase (beta-lactamase class C family)